MEMRPVVSSNLRRVGYDASSLILRIEFVQGGLYEYYDVPSDIYQQLLSAPSHGQYFHRYIRDVYRYHKLR